MVIASHLLLAFLGAHNQRYISVLIPYLFFYWWRFPGKSSLRPFSRLAKIGMSACSRYSACLFFSFLSPILIQNSSLNFKRLSKNFAGNYYGPIEGIVNTISGVKGLKRISPRPPQTAGCLNRHQF